VNTTTQHEPIALNKLLENVLNTLACEPEKPSARTDGFLFSGNRHDSVPRALLLDRRLTPLERNAWQVFRLMLNEDGITVFPTYEQLRPWLASTPCAGPASHETVARALTILRLTRWLSLVRKRRDPRTGRILGNVYVLHDEPLTPFEAMQLDSDYLQLVSQSLNHAAKAVQVVGDHTLKEIADDPLLSTRTVPTRLDVLAQRLVQQDESYAQDAHMHDSEEGKISLLRNDEPPSSDSEVGSKPLENALLRNPKKDSTIRSISIDKVRTTARARGDYRLPERFLGLKQTQQDGALMALQQVESSMRQPVLDEWDIRCRGSTIRNPAGYLFGIIQKAIRGEFNAWAAKAEPAPPKSASVMQDTPMLSSQPKAISDVAKQHIAQIREFLGKG